jgi:hypothetical protein
MTASVICLIMLYVGVDRHIVRAAAILHVQKTVFSQLSACSEGLERVKYELDFLSKNE